MEERIKDFYIASGDEAQKQIARAEEFSNIIRDFLVEKGIMEITEL